MTITCYIYGNITVCVCCLCVLKCIQRKDKQFYKIKNYKTKRKYSHALFANGRTTVMRVLKHVYINIYIYTKIHRMYRKKKKKIIIIIIIKSKK